MGNFLSKQEIQNIFDTYGITISGAPGTISGIFSGGISLSSSASLEGNPLTQAMQQGIDKTKEKAEELISSLGKKIGGKFFGGIVSGVGKSLIQDISKNLASTIQIYGSGSKFTFSGTMIFIPGLFHSSTYDDLENFATKATLAKNIAGVAAPYSQYLYNPVLVRTSLVPSLETELLSLNVANGKILVPGGLFCTNITRNYSEEKGEDGKPIYCSVSFTLEYFRDNFADEYKSFIHI